MKAYDAEAGRLVIEVEDTGAGIPEAALPRLFNEFDRLEAVDAYGDSGGIGLAVVRAVVGQLGGAHRRGVATRPGHAVPG